MSHLLTAGELKEFLKDVPDDAECVIQEKRYNREKEEYELKKQSPIHDVDYSEGLFKDSHGNIRFFTCYNEYGILGLDAYL